MIEFTTGNIFESEAQAIVNTVNTVGVMGKGIALQFKKAFPSNYKIYKEACKRKEFNIGDLLVVKEGNLTSGEKLIINFPTKQDWRKPSEYSFIEEGLEELKRVIQQYDIKSIAIPPLGAGNGGLKWESVKKIINEKLSDTSIQISVYEPNSEIQEKLKKERVKLTDARALLLFVLYDLVKNGEYVSEFSSEKVCYFLQRFGAKKYLKLTYSPNFYGPYSGKVKRLLNILNGSYLMGYSDMNKKPFEPLSLIADGHSDVIKYIEKNKDLKEVADSTIDFLNGFYSDFALELLSTIDYIIEEKKSLKKEVICNALENWSDRKRSFISNDRYIDISIKQLQSNLHYN